jgi:uncharacterized protein YbaP (TraB family)
MSLSRSRSPATLPRVLVLAALGCGAASSTSLAQAEARPAAARPLLLWSIESPDGRVSHLLGTMHVGVHLDDAVPAEQARALDRARVLLVEMDLASMRSPAMARHTLLPRGADLRELLPPELWPRLVAALAPMPEDALRRMRPWAAMSALMSRQAAALVAEREPAEDHDGPAALDLEVMERAHVHGVEIVGLETLDEQAALIGSIPNADVVQYIEHALDDTPDDGTTLREMTSAYLRADLEALERISFDPGEIARSPAVFDALLYARNDRWLAPLEAQLARGDAFIAVGLAHVIGDRGLLRLLEERGYRTARVVA